MHRDAVVDPDREGRWRIGREIVDKGDIRRGKPGLDEGRDQLGVIYAFSLINQGTDKLATVQVINVKRLFIGVGSGGSKRTDGHKKMVMMANLMKHLQGE